LTGRELEKFAQSRQRKHHRKIGHHAQGTLDTAQMHGKSEKYGRKLMTGSIKREKHRQVRHLAIFEKIKS
jgi:hypothetical protein